MIFLGDSAMAINSLRKIILSIVALHVLLGNCFAGSVGIYGVKKYTAELFSPHEIGVVFLPPQRELIHSYVDSGHRVFLTLNAFGGRRAWKEYPDSVPIMENGSQLTDSYGGVCPTHFGWRENRLALLAEWVRRYGGVGGVSGIFLDFIRYPGQWEHPHPNIPDTCWCDRCFIRFQDDAKVTLPVGLVSTTQKAEWIKKNVFLKWVAWNKEQISFFVRDARKVLDTTGTLEEGKSDRKLQLGVFLVPWRVSDFSGVLSFQLAQDVSSFSPYVDIYSPMVYHKMVGKPVEWVAEISKYYSDRVEGMVWPIVQAEDVSADEFGVVVEAVSASSADGLLVYSYRNMQEGQWEELSKFSQVVNLIENPEFVLQKETEHIDYGDENLLGSPQDWVAGGDQQQDSKHMVQRFAGKERALGISSGSDRQGKWKTPLGSCEKSARYRFEADFYRYDRFNPWAYPEVRIWGENYKLDTHRMYGRFQRLHVELDCPDSVGEREREFSFINSHPGETFWMKNPRLVKLEGKDKVTHKVPAERFFPLGVYGANAKNLKEIKESGFNTAVLRLNEKNIKACLAENIHCTLSVPRDPEKLILQLDRFAPLLSQGDFSFYVNDEPGIHSFPAWKANDIQRIIKERFPASFTNMAIFRSQVVPEYQHAADYFMLDQYPVPNMPMTWLSDSMDQAAQYVGRERLQSVIQAFGGEKYSNSGWPRLPTFEEMSCLSYLAIVHGSRGLYYYTYPSITSTEQGRSDLTRLMRRLNSMRSWLLVHNDEEEVHLKMTSDNKYGPKGDPAVHCVKKEQYKTRMLICVNTLRTYAKAEVYIDIEKSDT